MTEKTCGLIIYEIHTDCLFVHAECAADGSLSLPKGPAEEGETEEETAARAALKDKNLSALFDHVFRHEVTFSHEPGTQETAVYFLIPYDNIRRLISQKGFEIRLIGAHHAVTQIKDEADKSALYHAQSYTVWRYYHREVYEEGRRTAFPKLLYREHAVDIHSHILPGVDDGAQTMEEAEELALLDREEGMDVVFATPHYGEENGYAPCRELIRKQFKELRRRIKREQGDIPNPLVTLGTEWYCAEDIAERIRNQEAFPMNCSDWYMVEFLEWGSMTEPADVMIRRLTKMRRAGISTILAHPERYTAIQQDWNLAKRICDLGVKLQVNAYDLCLNKNSATRDLAQWMAQERLISFIGSDMHGTRIKEDGRPARRPQMKEGARWLYEHTDKDYADDVVRRNAEKFLGIIRLPVGHNREYI